MPPACEYREGVCGEGHEEGGEDQLDDTEGKTPGGVPDDGLTVVNHYGRIAGSCDDRY